MYFSPVNSTNYHIEEAIVMCWIQYLQLVEGNHYGLGISFGQLFVILSIKKLDNTVIPCTEICDCLSKNRPSSHNYKYLEIPI